MKSYMGTAEVTIDFKSNNLFLCVCVTVRKKMENAMKVGDEMSVSTPGHYPTSTAQVTLSPLSDKKPHKRQRSKG